MECQLKLKVGLIGLFGHMKMLHKFHSIWINENCTFFTNILTVQESAKIPEGKWLNKICPNFVELGYMDTRSPRKILSLNGAR